MCRMIIKTIYAQVYPLSLVKVKFNILKADHGLKMNLNMSPLGQPRSLRGPPITLQSGL